jgi:hypothetical protein
MELTHYYAPTYRDRQLLRQYEEESSEGGVTTTYYSIRLNIKGDAEAQLRGQFSKEILLSAMSDRPLRSCQWWGLVVHIQSRKGRAKSKKIKYRGS